jgi:amino acid transporter
MGEQPGLGDDRILSSFGYRQELRRALRSFSLYAVAFSIISITTGLFTNFGFGLQHLGPASIFLWPVAAVGQFLVALVVAELGTRIPLAGYSYQWGTRLVNPAYGWFVGLVGLAYMAVGGAAINFVVAAPLWATILGLNASDPQVLIVIAAVLTLATLAINIVSVALAARINNVAVFTEIAGTALAALVLLGLWATHPIHPASFLLDTGGVHGAGILRQLPYAALLGIFTIVGFELAADLSEEAVQARISVPRAVLWSEVSASVLGMVALVGFAIAIPNLHQITVSPVPLYAIVRYWLGPALSGIFILVVVFSIFALTVVGTAAGARLIYAMARDGILPFSSTLRRVNARTRTPIVALLVMAGLSVCFALFGYASDRTGGSAFLTLVTATAILPFVVYLLTVLAYVLRRPRLVALPGAFDLGRWAAPVMYLALAWVVIALAALTIPRDFWGADVVVGIVLAVAAIWYLVALHRRLRTGAAGVGAGQRADD